MVMITWTGEDEYHNGGAGPSFTTWGPYKFDKDKAVEVTDKDIIRRAKGNKFFKVEEQKPEADADPDLPDPIDHDAPVEHHKPKRGRKPNVKADE